MIHLPAAEMETFVLNIGNTNVQSGFFRDGQVHGFSVHPTDRLAELRLPANVPIAAATVVPEARKILRQPILWVTPDTVESIRLDTIDASGIGADRLANAVALAEYAELPGICVDCGTAITFDIVDRNRFHCGGLIAPGRKLVRRALHDFTAQLPDVPVMEKIGNAIGKNTIDAILSGTDRGTLELVKGLLLCVKAELGADSCCSVWVTGGDAGFFVPHIPGAVDAGIDFTLKGVGLIQLKHAERRDCTCA